MNLLNLFRKPKPTAHLKHQVGLRETAAKKAYTTEAVDNHLEKAESLKSKLRRSKR